MPYPGGATRQRVGGHRPPQRSHQASGLGGSGGSWRAGPCWAPCRLAVLQAHGILTRQATRHESADSHRPTLPAPGIDVKLFGFQERQRPRHRAAEDARQLRAKTVENGEHTSAKPQGPQFSSRT